MTNRLKKFADSATARLTTTYLLIIMLMSIGFSIVFYNTSSHALDRQVPPNDQTFIAQEYGQGTVIIQGNNPNRIHNFLADRADEGRHDLILRLILINAFALLAGTVVSYYLARRSLSPIEASMAAQEQFVSDASHELRTPLTAIQTSNEVALRNKKLTLPDAKQLITDNGLEIAKLQQLSDALLDLATNANHRPAVSEVSVQQIVTAAINQIIPIAQAKNISVEETTNAISVMANQTSLVQVLVILLDNAIKYSPDGSTIHISTASKANLTSIIVRDEGRGIRASDLPHIFRRFYRSDSARSNGHQGGYGLGLAIADNIIRSQDGSIGVTSELDKGSIFTVKLRQAKTSSK